MASIAFDCNRLYLPTQRKLNAAWREMEDGEQVCIVPTVAWELLDKLPCAFGELNPEVVADFHERVADEAKRRSNVPTSRRYGSALSKMWWCEQMLTEDSPYRLLEIDETQDEVVRDLMESFTPFDQISRQVVGFCSACKGALLEETGRAVFEHWKGADDIDALLGEISANLPMAMRQSELGHPSIMGYGEFAQERGVVDANGPRPS